MMTSVVQATYPLSPMQRGMLLHSFCADEPELYVEQVTCVLHEPVDAPALARAWKRVLSRHAALRTSFRWPDSTDPCQVVQACVDLPLVEHDWRGLSMKEREERFADQLRADRCRGFDLSRSPLMRTSLFRFGDEEHALVWTFHHCILDGRSFPLVLRELFTCYDAFSQNQEVDLPPPRPFGDYIAWLATLSPERSEGFWRRTFQGFDAPTEVWIPKPQACPTAPADRFGRQHLRLTEALTSALRDLAGRHGLTLNTVVQGAWAMLLGRYGGVRDVVFGATRACRRSEFPGSEQVVGVLANTLPVRARVSPRQRILTLLCELREYWLSLRSHEHTPLASIHDWTGIPAANPLFDTLAVFENYSLDRLMRAQGGRWTRREFRYTDQTHYPISLAGFAEARLRLEITYSRRHLDDDDASRMGRHLLTIFEGIATQPERRLSDLPLLTEAERERVLVEWSKGESAESSERWCFLERFESCADNDPDRVAVAAEEGTLTYGALNRRANQLARHLHRLGVAPEVPVGLCLETSLDAVVGLLGIWKAGGVYVPIDPDSPPERQAFHLEDSGIKVLLTEGARPSALPARAGSVVALERPWSMIRKERGENPVSRTAGDHVAYVIYTSGSTGKPKGVAVSHQAIADHCRAVVGLYGLDAQDRVLQFAPLSFDASLEQILPSLTTGACIVAKGADGVAPADVYRNVLEAGITVMNLPTAFWHELTVDWTTRIRRDPGWQLRLVIVGGDVMQPRSYELWRKLPLGAVRLLNAYGPTEAVITASTWEVQAELGTGAVPIGRPVGRRTAYLLDRDGDLVPIGLRGELHIGGSCSARGYWRRAGWTAEAFVPDPFGGARGSRMYRTGDLGRHQPDGNIEFIGRLDDQVKIRGFRVEAKEVEAALIVHPGVREAVVGSRADPSGNRRLVAHVAAASGNSPSPGELREFLRERLPDYMIPQAFVMMDALPRTRHGKVDSRRLPAPGSSVRDLTAARIAPSTPAEATLASIWSEVLGLTDVGAEDDFFELGGDSIRCIQVIGRARARGLEFTPQAMLEHPTLAALAAAARPISPLEEADARCVAVGPRQAEAREPRAPEFPGARTSRQELEKFLSGVEMQRVGRRSDVEDIYELSPMQQGMLFHSLERPDLGVYFEQLCLTCRGGMDVAAFQAAWADVVQRHAVLRSSIDWKALDQPVQVVHRQIRLPWTVLDWKNRGPQERQDGLESLLEEDRKRGFVLDRPPLMRQTLILSEEEAFSLVWSFHHLLLDRWSWPLLLQEVFEGYRARRSGKTFTPDPPRPYRDFVLWLQRQDLSEAEIFWRRQLAGFRTPTPFVDTLGGGMTEPTGPFREARLHLPDDVLASLRAMVRRRGLTTNVVMQGAWALLLSRYTGGSDVLFGSSVSGRPAGLPGVETMVGLFTNTLPVRATIAGSTPLLGWLRDHHRLQVERDKFSTTPLVKIREWSEVPARLPLFETLFTYQNQPVNTSSWSGEGDPRVLEIQGYGRSNYPFVVVVEPADRLSVRITYDGDRCDSSRIAGVMRDLQELLAQMATGQDRALGDLVPEAGVRGKSIQPDPAGQSPDAKEEFRFFR